MELIKFNNKIKCFILMRLNNEIDYKIGTIKKNLKICFG